MAEKRHTYFSDAEILNIQNKVNETHLLVAGNGDPEKGLCRQVALLNERQGGMSTTLNEIKKSLSGTVEVEKELEIQKRVLQETDKIQNLRFSKKSTVISLIFSGLMLFISLVFSYINSQHGSETKKIVTDTKAEVDMINTPVTDTRSGKTYLMPAGLLIDSLRNE